MVDRSKDIETCLEEIEEWIHKIRDCLKDEKDVFG